MNPTKRRPLPTGLGTVSVEAWAGDPWITLLVSGESGTRPQPSGERASEADGGSGKGRDCQGTGLRLAIVQGIARAHSGELSVREGAGGCRFAYRLPATSAP
ncbi:hypothetical protein AB0L13_40175 [Saccharopolyspora shandongensis]|uniref:hypothetical protein n=1 Tax=Saccharopolyspora shandongensis TaxID=418495 RepID=UPI003448DD06